jgi:hypothetical protein
MLPANSLMAATVLVLAVVASEVRSPIRDRLVLISVPSCVTTSLI